ncbi:glycosyltransferase [Flavitalea flava]
MNKTLVILTPGFPSGEDDTTCVPPKQVFIQAVARAYPNLKIILLTFEYPFTTQEYSWHGHTVFPFNGWGKARVARKLLWVKVWKRLNKIRKENEVIGLFSFWCGESAFLGKWFGKRYHIPHRIWIAGQDAKKDNPFVRFIRPRPEELIAMSDFLVSEFASNHGLRPAHTVPIGIDPRLFPAQKNTEKNLDLFGAGSLLPLKQYDLFLDIARQLADHLPGLSVMICGKGPEEKKLKTRILNLRLEETVQLSGEKPMGEVLALMQRCRVFLHPSSYEGFGSVCIEALYAGAHVVSFCQPMAACIDHWHVVRTPEEMFVKVLELLQDPDLSHEPVLPFLMEDSARLVMGLFGYKE